MAEAAALYARAGWPVMPCRPRGKQPMTEHGLRDASCDPEQVAAWWRRWPKANVAVRTGSAPEGAGLVVLDVDGDAGERALQLLLGGAPATAEQVTGGGGRQLLYALGPGQRGLQSAGKLGPQLDTRGEGGYVILPPSVHPSGAVYWWANLAPLAPAPRWLLRPPPTPPRPRPAPPPAGSEPAALRGLVLAVAQAAEGQRNDLLNWAAYRAGEAAREGRLDP